MSGSATTGSGSNRVARILIVEDEGAIREMLVRYLARQGYECDEAADATAAEQALRAARPDLVLLDWMLPGGRSGYDLARALRHRRETREIPIIMVTARAEEADKVQSLDAGADDYITKPFSLAELAARVNALLRRAAPAAATEVVEVGGLRVDPATRRVTAAAGDAVGLGPTEFRLLHFLMTHRERVYSRAQLIDLVWGEHVYVEERTVDVHIRRLRKSLQPAGHDGLIQTVRGAGYRLSDRD